MYFFGPDYEERATLRDGTPIVVRTVRPDDKELLRRGFHKLSPESRYLRFFTAMPRLPDRMLDRLVATDGWKHVAIGAEVATDDPDGAEGLGVARFIRLDDTPDVAEVAVAVVDGKQRLGLGCAQLERGAVPRDPVHAVEAAAFP